MQQRCNKCVMDVSAKEITFDEDGVCNFCRQAEKALQEIKNDPLPFKYKLVFEKGDPRLRLSKGKYDVLIGLSGGVDSSTVLHYAVRMGLRPLCFSIDNGWNDPRADENIMRLVEGLKVPFFRYTIDRKLFSKLQGAFMEAGLKNIEIPTDHILMAATYQMAAENGIKYVLSGGNVATESIMPVSWGYNARDLVHIKDVYKKYTGHKLKGLPTISLLKWNWYKWVKGIKIVYLLDHMDYNREDSIELLKEEYGYKPYGEKHCESVWTQWFQNFYLFTKFGIDKRKAHLSSMINSGQMIRERALEILMQSPVYPELGIERRVLRYEPHDYTDFKTDEKLFTAISNMVRFLKTFKRFYKHI